MHSPDSSPHAAATRPRWLALLIAGLLLLAAVRGLLMVLATPLVALANNYDQVRYAVCIGVYPWRPGQAVDAPSFKAPLQGFAFQAQPQVGCYLTSDLVFQGAVAGIYRAAEAMGSGPVHSVRTLGLLRWLAWLLAAGLFCRLFWREGQPLLALGSAAWLAGLGMDPVNSLLINTFYAEAGTLFFAYLCVNLALLTVQRPSFWRLAALFLAGLLLGTSKVQHLALPLLLALGLGIGAWRAASLRKPALALLIAGAVALPLQLAQTKYGAVMFHHIGVVNSLNLVTTAALPAADDPAQAATTLGLDAHCAASSGKSYYHLQEPMEQACPGIEKFSRARFASLALSEPLTVLRMLASIPPQMLPWIPDYLGTVAGIDGAPLPDEFASVQRPTAAWPWLIWPFLLAPGLIWLVLLARRSTPPALLAFAGLSAAMAWGVAVVSLFGDGRVELARHAHLATNAAFAFLPLLLLCWLAQRVLRRR